MLKRIGYEMAVVTAVALGISYVLFLVFVTPFMDNARQQPQSQGQNEILGQIGASVKPIYPQVTVVKDKISSIGGLDLVEVAKSPTSVSIERVNGTSKGITNDGQATLSLKHAIAAVDGQDVIAATVTNTGTTKFYLTGFLIKGGTTIPGTQAGGIQNLDAYVVDDGYSPEVWGSIPRPAITQPVVLNPGESMSAYIKGKWIEGVTNEPINSFSVGVRYVYDVGAIGYEPGNAWSISISDVKLP